MVSDCKAAEFYYANVGSEPAKGTYTRKIGNQHATVYTFGDRSKVACYRDGSIAWAPCNGVYLGVKTAVVGNCKPGQVIEMLDNSVLNGKLIGSGRYYKLWYRLPDGRFKAFKQFTGEHITLHHTNKCRIINGQIEGF